MGEYAGQGGYPHPDGDSLIAGVYWCLVDPAHRPLSAPSSSHALPPTLPRTLPRRPSCGQRSRTGRGSGDSAWVDGRSCGAAFPPLPTIVPLAAPALVSTLHGPEPPAPKSFLLRRTFSPRPADSLGNSVALPR